MMLIYAVGQKHMIQEEEERQIVVARATNGVKCVVMSILGQVVIRHKQSIPSHAAVIQTDIAVGANSADKVQRIPHIDLSQTHAFAAFTSQVRQG